MSATSGKKFAELTRVFSDNSPLSNVLRFLLWWIAVPTQCILTRKYARKWVYARKWHLQHQIHNSQFHPQPLQVPLQSQHAHVLQDFVHTRFPRANELQIRAGYTIPSTISFSSPHNSPVANELQIQAQSSSHPMWPVPVTAQWLLLFLQTQRTYQLQQRIFLLPNTSCLNLPKILTMRNN